MIDNNNIMVFGHRGANNRAPENTLKSFQKAIELGADYIEFDVHLSNDNEIVVIHDKNTYRTTGSKGRIKDLSLEDIKNLDAGEGEKIPLLKEVINLASGKIKLQIEIKAKGMAQYIVDILKSADIMESCLISSFFYKELVSIRQLEPKLKIALLVIGIRKKSILKKISRQNFQAVHPYYKFISKKFIEDAHKHDIKVHGWTVDSKKVMHKLISFGIDGIITNDIQQVLDEINNKND